MTRKAFLVYQYLIYVIQRQGRSVPKHVLHLCRPKIDFLHNSQKHHKNKYNLNILFVHQNSPREVQIFFFTRLGRNGRAARKLSYVCGGFNEKKSPLRLRVFINREVHVVFSNPPTFSLFEKKVLVAPAPLTILTKHIVRLRCCCSCEMCRTSAVALLVISKTSVNLS